MEEKVYTGYSRADTMDRCVHAYRRSFIGHGVLAGNGIFVKRREGSPAKRFCRRNRQFGAYQTDDEFGVRARSR